ncbi:iron-sulfur cluster assembly accessory protein [Ammoniphilus sp. YIM 78166]|uniref:HesB/IscA family protein n=1 Tax=Ammoniphilus sp. YIM 78166 TaxID=1644106 RepID=UPI0010702D0F|nr:iron-sulfur cluster assembly accessory protein [Ammoniphilus sp. YIM 78166]
MKCSLTETAAAKVKEIISGVEDPSLRLRVFVSHAHGDHAHYGLGIDKPSEKDEVVEASGIEVLLEKGNDFLDGVVIDYLPDQDAWSVINPAKGNHGDH